jgi:hypothetical protein
VLLGLDVGADGGSQHAPAQALQVRAAAAMRQPETERERRARETLLSHMTERQQRDYLSTGTFRVRGGMTGTRYVVVAGKAGVINVYVTDDLGRSRRALCAYPHEPGLPEDDILCTQLLFLQYDEQTFLEQANPWRADETFRFSC